MRKISLIFLCALLATACNTQLNQSSESKKPKNIILMIGDGMGTAQVYSAFIKNKGHLNLQRCTHTGFAFTNSASNLITDSGAGGTAIACGVKTTNYFIGMSSDSSRLQSILEIAEDHNKATALVASSAVTHATPASFIAHTPSRYNYEDIASDYLKTDIDIFIGGGLKYFNQRSDSTDLISQLEAKDYQIAYNMDQLLNSKSNKIAGLIYENHPPKFSEGRGDFLSKASLKAIEVLNKKKNGFFMMIEGSQIDWAAHDKDNEYLINETVDFDNTVGDILDFAELDGETLVIILADHETGGYGITGGDLNTGEVKGEFIFDNHTAVMVPIFAFGPGAENFSGMMQNTAVFEKMHQLFGF